jgi:hypothetical protein
MSLRITIVASAVFAAASHSDLLRRATALVAQGLLATWAERVERHTEQEQKEANRGLLTSHSKTEKYADMSLPQMAFATCMATYYWDHRRGNQQDKLRDIMPEHNWDACPVGGAECGHQYINYYCGGDADWEVPLVGPEQPGLLRGTEWSNGWSTVTMGIAAERNSKTLWLATRGTVASMKNAQDINADLSLEWVNLNGGTSVDGTTTPMNWAHEYCVRNGHGTPGSTWGFRNFAMRAYEGNHRVDLVLGCLLGDAHAVGRFIRGLNPDWPKSKTSATRDELHASCSKVLCPNGYDTTWIDRGVNVRDSCGFGFYRGYELHLTGHSLGGAAAVLHSIQLTALGFDVRSLQTFGQPAALDTRGTNCFVDIIKRKKMGYTRYATVEGRHEDWVVNLAQTGRFLHYTDFPPLEIDGHDSNGEAVKDVDAMLKSGSKSNQANWLYLDDCNDWKTAMLGNALHGDQTYRWAMARELGFLHPSRMGKTCKVQEPEGLENKCGKGSSYFSIQATQHLKKHKEGNFWMYKGAEEYELGEGRRDKPHTEFQVAASTPEGQRTCRTWITEAASEKARRDTDCAAWRRKAKMCEGIAWQSTAADANHFENRRGHLAPGTNCDLSTAAN